MKFLFLDLGRRTGFAYGESGTVPVSGSITLRGVDDDNGLALGKMARWLRDHVKEHGKEDLWGIEHWMPPKSSKDLNSVEDALRQNGAVHAIAGVYGIGITEPYPATIRSQVCGRPHRMTVDLKGNKVSDTKNMVIETMIFRRLIPADCRDDNRADAVCGWVWMEANKHFWTAK